MNEKKIFFKNSKGQKIAALLAMPKEKNPPLIIIVHGFKGTKEHYPMVNNAIQPFLDNGFAVLRIDCRGTGESDMEFKDMTLYTEAEDILTTLEFVKTLPINQDKVGIIAISMSSSVAIIAKPKVKTMVFWGPGWKLGLGSYYDQPQHRKTIKEEGVWHVSLKNIYNRKKILKHLVAGKELFNEMLTLDLTKELPKLSNIPTLILRGDKDEVTGGTGDEKVVKLMKSELKIIKGGDHNFLEPEAEAELIKTTIEWLNKNL